VRWYKVCFDGKWQSKFDDLDDALNWGREVGETGRMVHVVKGRVIRPPQLIAIFPEDRADEGREIWRTRGAYGGLGGGNGPF
jgi:hypothetical protein